jgi:hypothetical protein
VLARTLVEVKVTKHPLPLRDEWLNQLLGYVLLDHGDWYELEQVAVFLGRQARLVAWPLAELLSELTGDPRVTLAELRGEFRALLERVWAHNSQFPFHHLWVTRTPPPWRQPSSRNSLTKAPVEPAAAPAAPPTQPPLPGGRALESSTGGRAGRLRARLSGLLDGSRRDR